MVSLGDLRKDYYDSSANPLKNTRPVTMFPGTSWEFTYDAPMFAGAGRSGRPDSNGSALLGLLGSSAQVQQDTGSTVGSGSARRVSGLPEYIDAPLASQYRMDRSTAYTEALSNTAHQREVRDLLAAGLNPVLSVSGKGSSVFTNGQVLASGSARGSSSTDDSGSIASDLVGAVASAVFNASTAKYAVKVVDRIVDAMKSKE